MIIFFASLLLWGAECAPTAVTTVSVPANVAPNEAFEASVSFDNQAPLASDVGFGPFIDVLVSSNVASVGAPTWQGITLVHKITTFATTTCLPAPYLLPDRPISSCPSNTVPSLGCICGQAGQKYMSILLPFSSYGIDAAVVKVSIPMTNGVQPVQGTVFANGGYVYGATTILDPSTPIVNGDGLLAHGAYSQASFQSPAVEAVFENDWADPVGFGYDNRFNYDLSLNAASGYKIDGATAVVSLPTSQAFGGIRAKSLSGGGFVDICVPVGGSAPAGCVAFNSGDFGIASIETTGPANTPCYGPSGSPPCDGSGGGGGGTVKIIYSSSLSAGQSPSVRIGAVPVQNDENGNPFALAGNIEDLVTSAGLVISDSSFSSTACACGGNFNGVGSSGSTRQSLKIVKSAAQIVSPTNRGVVPGVVLKYTLTVELATTYTLQNVKIDERLGDGQSLTVSSTYPITYVLPSGTVTETTAPTTTAATTGDLGDRLFTLNFPAPGSLTGKAIAVVSYHVIVDEAYRNPIANVVANDCLNNAAVVEGTNPNGVAPNVQETKTSSVQTSVPGGGLDTSFYALNGVLCSTSTVCNPRNVPVGVPLTIRYKFDLATLDYSGLKLSEAFPIPLFNVGALSWFINGALRLSGDTVDLKHASIQCSNSQFINGLPALNRWCVLQTPAITPLAPTYTLSATDMSWTLNFGANSDATTTSQTGSIDLLLTVAMTDIPWIDNFDVAVLDKQVDNEASPCAEQLTDFQFFKTFTPLICSKLTLTAAIKRGVTTLFDNKGLGLNFAVSGAPWTVSSVISQAKLQLQGVGSSISTSIEAGNQLRFAASALNTAAGIAYDVILTLPFGSASTMTTVSNLRVYRGDGTLLTVITDYSVVVGTTSTDVNIKQVAGTTTRGSTNDNTGLNVVVVFFDVLITQVHDGRQISADGSLKNYAAIAGGANYVTSIEPQGRGLGASCLSSSVTLTPPVAAIATVSVSSDDSCTTNNAQAAVGEIFCLDTTVTLPYGTFSASKINFHTLTTKSMQLTSTVLPANSAGLTFSPSPTIAPLAPIAAPLAASPGEVTLGTIVVPINNAVTSFVFKTCWKATDNAFTNAEVISFPFSFATTTLSTVSQTVTETILKQTLTLTGTVSNSIPVEGELIDFCYTATRTTSASCAYNLQFSIPVPSEYVLQSSPPPTISINGGAPTPLPASNPVAATVPTIGRNDAPTVVCFKVEANVAIGASAVTTTGTITYNTSPELDGAAQSTTAPVVVTPSLAAVVLTTTTDDSCTTANNVHVGELVTLTSTLTLQPGELKQVILFQTWDLSSEFSFVSSTISADSSCLLATLPTNPTVTSGRVSWSVGDIRRQATATCTNGGSVVIQSTALVTSTAAGTITVTSSYTTQPGSTPISPPTTPSAVFTVVAPNIVATSTLTPATGDADQATQYCVSLTNVATLACAYGTTITVPLPSQFVAVSPTPFVATIGNLNPSQASGPTCFDVRAAPTLPPGSTTPFVATVLYNTDTTPTDGVSLSTTTTRSFAAPSPTITSRIVSTSDSCTSQGVQNAALTGAQPGESIKYSSTVRMPEGQTANVVVQFTLPSGLLYVANSALMGVIGSNIVGVSVPLVTTPTASTLVFTFALVTNNFDNIVDVKDDFEVTFDLIVAPTAASGAVTVAISLSSSSITSPVVASAPTVEIVRPALRLTSTATPNSGAWGDVSTIQLVVQHDTLSSGCARQVEICEQMPTLTLQSLNDIVISPNTLVPRVVSGGFCVDVPLLSGTPVSISFPVTMQNLPAGPQRCADATATFTSAVSNGMPRDTDTGSACITQVTLESLGDFVFFDNNGDGIQNSGDTPIVGVVVSLRPANSDTIIATTATSLTGYYEFNRFQHGIVANTLYDIDVPPQNLREVTVQNSASAGDLLDSDAALDAMKNRVIIQDASTPVRTATPTFDFGFAPPMLIGNFIWRDLNGDGIQALNEPGLRDVVVSLRTSSLLLITTATTDSDGLYQFSSLNIDALAPSTTFVIDVALDTQASLATTVGGRATFLVPTTKNVGGSALDSNADLVGGNIARFTLTTPSTWTNDLSLDIGLVPPALLGFRIGNFVFLDKNNDGLQNAGDVPIVGAVVQVFDGTNILQTTATDNNGLYSFSSLSVSGPLTSQSPYTIRVLMTTPAVDGLLVTTANAGSDDALDSDGVLSGSFSQQSIVTPIDGTNDFTFDFGFREIVLGGDLWRDVDGDGVNDDSTPIGLLVVSLYDSSNLLIATTAANNLGRYSFSSSDFPSILPGASYSIGVPLPATLQPTEANVGVDTTDSDGQLQLAGDVRAAVVAPTIGSNFDTDFGFAARFSIGNFVFLDVNGDGIQQSADVGIDGVVVRLLEGSVLLATTTTAGGGLYRFDSVLPSLARALLPNTSGFSIVIDTSQANLVALLTTPADVASATSETDSDGIFTIATSESASAVTTPAYGVDDRQYDFGFARMSIGNLVFQDLDADGIQDSSEPGFAGITVELLNSVGNVIASTTTDINGVYLFTAEDGVRPLTEYSVRVALSDFPNDRLTHTDAGTDDVVDSDASVSGLFAVVSIPSSGALGSTNLDVADFGFQKLLEIGNLVFFDADFDGAFNVNFDQPLSGVTITCSGVGFLETTQSNSFGLYKFSRFDFPTLLASTLYTLTIDITQPALADYQPTILNTGSADNVNDGVWDRVSAVSRTTATTPTLGNISPIHDFGFVRWFSIGDFVFEDVDGSDTQTVGDEPLVGVTVDLYVAGSLISSTTTDANGLYTFSSKTTTNYWEPEAALELRIGFATNAEKLVNSVGEALILVDPDVGGIDTSDSDAVFNVPNNRAVISVGSGVTVLGSILTVYDFGFVGPIVVGDFVWLDSNGNGRQDANEPGIASVIVEMLLGPTIVTTATDSNGQYYFDSLAHPTMQPSTTYPCTIRRDDNIPELRDLMLTLTDAASASSETDNDAVTAAYTPTFFVQSVRTGLRGSSVLEFDYGFVPAIIVTGTVFVDDNVDGLQVPPPSTLLPGVVVSLRDANGVVIATTATQSNGQYTFSSADSNTLRTILKPNTVYTIAIARSDSVIAATLLQETFTDVGSNDAIDSDSSRSSDGLLSVASGTTGAYGSPPLDLDFGYVGPIVIGDLVWEDTNNNDVKDPSDPGINGIVVNLLLNGNVIATQTTATVAGIAGVYLFNSRSIPELVPGSTYTISVDALQTPLTYTQFPAAIVKPFRPVTPGVGADPAFDSNGLSIAIPGNTETSNAVATVIAPNYFQSDLTIDFGWERVQFDTLLIGDYVWIDSNNDGIQQDVSTNRYERPIAGVVVDLLSAGGTFIASTATSSTGLYTFDSVTTPTMLPLTNYIVSIDLSQSNVASFGIAQRRQGADRALDSDGDATLVAGFVRIPVTTHVERANRTYDFGFTEARVGDRVWNDLNGDGLQQSGEVGIGSVTILLYDVTGANVIATTQTDSDGLWSFTTTDGLVSGVEYRIVIDLVGPLANFQPTRTGFESQVVLDGTTSSSFTFTAPAIASTDLTQDAGYVSRFAIGNRFFIDKNSDGEQNGGDVDLGLVTLTLFDGSTPLATTTTDFITGLYSFSSIDVPAMQANTNYVIRVDGTQSSLVAYRPTRALVGGAGTDSNLQLGTSSLQYELLVRTPNYGVIDNSFDAGLVERFNIGNYVFHDVNADGVQNVPDVALSSVLVQLFAHADRTTVLASTSTDTNGFYNFDSWIHGLTPSTTYTISVSLSSGALLGFQPTIAGQGGDAGLDSSIVLVAPGATVAVDNLIVTGSFGSSILTYDFGFVRRLVFGDRVFFDNDGDGVQLTSGQAPLPFTVAVRLLDPNTFDVVQTTQTDAQGFYEFDSLVHSLLPTQQYIVSVVVPTGYQGSPNSIGGDPNLDSNGVLSTTRNAMETLVTIGDYGSADRSIDFGFRLPFVIGNRFWLDSNGNGQQDNVGNEKNSFAGLVLELRDSNDALIATTATITDGIYTFSSLEFTAMEPLTTYSVVVQLDSINSPQFVGLRPTLKAASGVLTDVNSDVARSDDRTRFVLSATTPTYGQSDLTFDAGFIPEITISGTVLPSMGGGIVVQLLLADGTPFAVTSTNADGTYAFSNDILSGIDYRIVVDTTQYPGYMLEPGSPPSYSFATEDATLIVTTGVYGSTSTDNDFKFVLQFNIGNYVWLDGNGDGSQGGVSDTPLENIRVELYRTATNTFLSSTVTDINGLYLFNSLTHSLLRGAEYTILIDLTQTQSGGGTLQSRFQPTRSFAASESLDSNGVLTSNELAVTAAATAPDYGVDDLSYDFGFVEQFNIGDRVFRDTNANGIQDSSDVGIEDVTVALLDASGAVITTTLTDSNGFYSFNSRDFNLKQRTAYFVSVSRADNAVALSGLEPTFLDAGIDDLVDSDARPSVDDDQIFVVPFLSPNFGTDDLSLDFGFAQQIEIGNFVFLDANLDGVQQTSEAGIRDVVLELRDFGTGEVLSTTVTNAGGFYSFDPLSGLRASKRYQITIQIDQDALLLLQPTLTNAAAASSTTDSNGVDERSMRRVSAEVAPMAPFTVDKTFDFGFYRRVYVGDFVWLDVDADGRQDSTEPGLPGVVVSLVDALGVVVATTATDSAGAYRFDSYSVEEMVPRTSMTIVINDQPALAQVQPTFVNNVVDNDVLDSDGVYCVPCNANRVPFVVAEYGSDQTMVGDFGYLRQNVGNRVWRDDGAGNALLAGNGLQDAGEVGIPGIVIRLLNGTTLLATTTTDSTGFYYFNGLKVNLIPGQSFILSIDRSQMNLDGLQLTTQKSGILADIDSNFANSVDLSVATTTFIAPLFGTDDFSLDAGYVPSMFIGDYVFRDVNRDGLQTSVLDYGIGGCVVRLYLTNGTLLATTVTASDGFYQFNSLQTSALVPNGVYIVAIERTQIALTGLVQTLFQASSNSLPALDSNGEWRSMAAPSVLAQFGNNGDDVVIAVARGPAYGTSDLSYDFGFVSIVKLGNRVWLDLTRDGVQNDGEIGLSGVSVTIRFSDDTIGTTITDENGQYSFSTLFFDKVVRNGVYTISIPLNQPSLSNLIAAPSNVGSTDDSLDSDGVVANNASTISNAVLGTDVDDSFDFGFMSLVPNTGASRIGDYVWLDSDGDGIQDSTETPLSSVTVQLRTRATNTVIGSTVTDVNGRYSFDSTVNGYTQLEALSIVISLDQVALRRMGPTQPNTVDDALDSDGILISSSLVAVNLLAPPFGSVNSTYDFGFARLEIGDYVWHDANSNGLQDSTERAFANVRLDLQDVLTGVSVATTLTNNNGVYRFASTEVDLQTSTSYRIVIDISQAPLLGYVVTNSFQGDSSIDSNAQAFDNRAIVTKVTAATFGSAADRSLDFGFKADLSLGDFVWKDLNGDGLQSIGEQGISGITVSLLDASGVIIATTFTDNNGRYQFTSARDGLLPLTSYIVAIPVSSIPGLAPTRRSLDNDPALDSNGIPNSNTARIEAAITTGIHSWNDVRIDFGFVDRLSIGDRAWLDSNGNGIQDANEAGVAGVTLALSDDTLGEIGRTLTNSGGQYLFESALFVISPLQEYTISVVSYPNDLELTRNNVGRDDAVDSDARYIDGIPQIHVIAPPLRGVNLTFDIGFVQKLIVGDYVWRDLDEDGQQDSNEPALSNVKLQLWHKDNKIAQTSTNDQGRYQFDSLESNLEPNTKYTILLPHDQDALDKLAPTKSFSGSSTTDSNGELNNDDDIVFEFQTGDVGSSVLTYDFGFVKPVSITGVAWLDEDGDGVRDSDEKLLDNVRVVLYDDSGDKVATTTTDDDGRYEFTSINDNVKPKKDYEIRIDLDQSSLNDLAPTKTNVGDGDKDNDGKRDGQRVVVDIRSPESGETKDHIDFGFVFELTVGNFVWRDDDGDGLQDDDEKGLEGITLRLRDEDGRTLAETKTDENGKYLFTGRDGLEPNRDFTIDIELKRDGNREILDELVLCPRNSHRDGNSESEDELIDSDGKRDDRNDRVIVSFEAPDAGSRDLTIDIGFMKPIIIGDFVWLDVNADGIQQNNERGIKDVIVELRNANNEIIARKTTKSDGRYEFTSKEIEDLLPRRRYVVSLDTKQNALSTLQPSPNEPMGAPRDRTSKGVLQPQIEKIVADVRAPLPGERDMTIDFGLFNGLALSAGVWLDADVDGERDSNELPVRNVVVELLDGNDRVIATGTTTASGGVLFTSGTVAELVAGNYTIRIDRRQPALEGFAPTRTKVDGVPPTLDSDGALVGEYIVAELVLIVGAPPPRVDFGLIRVGECARNVIGGLLFVDANNNDAFDNGERLLSGVRVELRTASAVGSIVATTSTSASGQYSFGGVGSTISLPNNTDFIVRVAVPSDVQLPARALASSTSTTADLRASTVVCGSSNVNFAFLPRSSMNGILLGDFVFIDKNGNGRQDSNENGIDNVIVELRSVDGNSLLTTTITSNGGQYQFSSADGILKQNNIYIVAVQLDQSQIVLSQRYPTDARVDGVLPTLDSDGSLITINGFDYSATTVRVNSTNVQSIDFGFFDCVLSDVAEGPPEARVNYTGDAKKDFRQSIGSWTYYQDNPLIDEEPDVGLPFPAYPSTRISGWDLRGVYMAYSSSRDRLFVGFDCFGICGDADGDGNPGAISGNNEGARDLPDLSGSETFAISMDLNNDDKFDIIVGVPSRSATLPGCESIACVGAFSYLNNNAFSPGLRFGTRFDLPVSFHCNPSSSCPDIEFTIDSWSNVITNRLSKYDWKMSFEVFAGSFDDGGIGEDFMGIPKKVEARFKCPLRSRAI